MTHRPRSLRARLAAGAVLLVVGSVAATGLVDALTLRRFMQGQIDSRLDTQVDALVAALAPGPDGRPALRRAADGPPFDRPGSGWFWEVLSGSEVVARSASLPPTGLIAPSPRAEDAPPPAGRPPPPRPGEASGPDGEPLRVRSAESRVGPAPVTVLAAAPLRALTDPLRDVLVSLTLTLALIGAGLIGAALVQVRTGLEPLRRLQRDLAAVRAGRIERVPGGQPAEIAPLALELNALLAENAENLARARRHVANLAHGLKTPLATLAVRLDADPDGFSRRLVDLMDRRIRHHLGRARAAALGGAVRARTPLAPHVADLAAALPKIYAERGIACAVEVPADFALGCDAQDVDEMLGNLMDNAFKWAGSRVRVSARAEGRDAVVSIEDDGPGLPESAVPDALRPGRRLDEAAPGHGFGLPIARELAELHGGGLALGRSRFGGLRATLTLPLAERRSLF